MYEKSQQTYWDNKTVDNEMFLLFQIALCRAQHLQTRRHVYRPMLRQEHCWFLSLHILLYWVPSDHGATSSPCFGASQCSGVQGEADGLGTYAASSFLLVEAGAADLEVPFAVAECG